MGQSFKVSQPEGQAEAASEAKASGAVALMVFGPTASGKTGLGITLSQALDGEVINADSRQVYQRMPILTAMPTAAERAAAPHHLYDFLPATTPFSVADYMAAAEPVASEIVARGKLPVFVGGTGLYMKGLMEGMSQIPQVPEEIIDTLKKRLATHGAAVLHAELGKVDPELAARLYPGDSQRIVRALGVYQAAGKPLSAFQKQPRQGALPYRFVKIALSPPREQVLARQQQRFQAMVEAGLIDEIRALREQGVGPAVPAFKAHGLPEMLAYLDGQLDWDAAQTQYLANMRQYAKRQLTWLRHQYKPDIVLATPQLDAALLTRIRNLMETPDHASQETR